MKKKLLAGLMLLSVVPVAQAENKGGLFVEPMITYERGDGKIDYPRPVGDSDTDLNGFGVGARLGFHIYESIFIGADGRYSQPKFKETGLDTNAKAEAWNWGPTVGMQMPTDLGIRVWGTYIVDGEVDPEKDNGVNAKFTQGSGYRLGAGIKLGMVSLNAEWQKMDYDKTKASTRLADFSTKNANLKNDTWVFSVSFPIAL